MLAGSLEITIENDYSVDKRRRIIIMVLFTWVLWVVVNALGHVMVACELPDKSAVQSHYNPITPAVEPVFQLCGFIESPVFVSIQKSRRPRRRACWAQ